ncbi:coat protein [ssRNA phage Zoerhiza.4_22]|uniref:Coat protein n=2 Tax=Leviviricetes TaxID=2842243 RepID=A0A8S5L3H6_9VIRU|nr:coat protein [ssRNA phage Zoerhiza.4_22]QDH86762.1 MAG: hypothetical protein H4Rhizo45395_000003 [Leviviridae sp.]DAD51877.1 TPA_asm: coat protein [ssRNA phage Zoerhiza.4_22]
MAIGDPITFAYDGANITLNRTGWGSYSSVYEGVATGLALKLSFKHTIPAIGADGESHLVRLDVDHFDTTTLAFLRRTSAWISTRTDGLPQDNENSEDAMEALVDFLTDGNITKVVGRQS